MSRKQKKYTVPIPEASLFLQEVFGYRIRIVNFYHLKVTEPETKIVFDWYHTTGTVIMSINDQFRNIGSYCDYELLANRIQKEKFNYLTKHYTVV